MRAYYFFMKFMRSFLLGILIGGLTAILFALTAFVCYYNM